MKVIEISEKDFNEMVQDLTKCKEEREELRKAVNFLNNQIREFNEKFANTNKKNN